MRLLHLIKQNDGVGAAAHHLRQLTSLVIPHVAGRRTNQAAHAVLLHVLTHVNTHQGLLSVEQVGGQSLGQLSLTHTSWPQEHEAGNGPVGVTEACPAALDGVRHHLHRLVLPNDPLVQLVREVQQLVTLTGHQLGYGDACPLADDLGNVCLRDLLLEQLAPHRALAHQGLLRALQLLLQLNEGAVLELGSAVEVVVALSLLDLEVHAFNLLLDVLDSAHLALLPLPLLCDLRLLALELLQLCVQAGQAGGSATVIGGGLVEAQALHLQLQNLAINLVQHLWLRGDLHLELGSCLVDQINGLVWQEAVRYVPVAQHRRLHQGAVTDPDTVVHLVPLTQAAQD
mmetsp:Transcript_29892/g.66116  ORF Transcript_29892/g.66116 Transcript_29892/m.66116 type:complete len:342 (-) Transcript_29892:1431-2456(-)